MKVDEVLFIKIVEESEVGTKTEVGKMWLGVHVASEVGTGWPYVKIRAGVSSRV